MSPPVNPDLLDSHTYMNVEEDYSRTCDITATRTLLQLYYY